MNYRIIVAFLIAVSLAIGASAYQIAYVLRGHSLFRVDLQLGTAELIGDTGFYQFESHLGFGPNGTLYAISQNGVLFSIDESTAQASTVGSVPLGDGQIALGIRTDSLGRFVLHTTDKHKSYFFELELSSLTVSHLLTIDSEWLGGMAPQGDSIYTIFRPCGVGRIDLTSGGIDYLPDTPECGLYYGSLADLAFDHRGQLWTALCTGHWGDYVQWGRLDLATGQFVSQSSISSFDCPDSIAISSQAAFPIPESGTAGKALLIGMIAFLGVSLLVARKCRFS